MMFRRILLTALIAAGAVGIVACDNGSAASAEQAAAPAEEAAAPAEEAAAPTEEAAAPATGTVEVPEGGKEFDPPVEIAQLPDGVWYCDMGTAHYARQHEGDGTCPLCHMKLKQK